MTNTPYPELRRDTTRLAAELALWNAANARARREYTLHPLARCGHGGDCTKAYRRAQAERRRA